MVSLDRILYCIAIIGETEVLPFNAGWSPILISQKSIPKYLVNQRNVQLSFWKKSLKILPELWKGEIDTKV